MALLLGFAALTLFACFILKGISININITHKHEQQKQPETPQYNESLAGMLPPEVQEYYQQTKGFNKF